eukprot:CAMPEP_0119328028 /NCGR_PEP_ID=MMETSP1333-20130426/72251_1 /TAXON_ID=418940 /ORGANISM="Scyphosphaera apsteinii, Strain RCC1455" /LENGTH=250 /DNA_ID=CAMNT_0007336771 /DNA_START=161 /DNA_END=910 /DNA_ORIENTATION=+
MPFEQQRKKVFREPIAIDHSKWISDIPSWRTKLEVTNSLSCRAPHFKEYMKHFGPIPSGKQKEKVTPRRASEFLGGTYEPFSQRVETPSHPERSLHWATAPESQGKLGKATPGELYRGTKRLMMRVKEDAAMPPPEQTLQFSTVDKIMPPPAAAPKLSARDWDADSTPVYVTTDAQLTNIEADVDTGEPHELDGLEGYEGGEGVVDVGGYLGERPRVSGAPFTGLYDLASGLHYLDYTRCMPGGRPKSMW